MISKFFIERPVLANVLAILFVLIGAVAVFELPISQYPNVVPPTIAVATRYPGASAETVMNTVALPIEQQVNGVNHMIYMQSNSASDGSYALTVTFAIGTDLDFAQVLVQNRVSTAMASLPQAVQAQGVTVQQQSTSILQIISLTSPNGKYDNLFLSNYATINLLNELQRVPGVGNVNIYGVGQYAMRIWLDPTKLYARGLTPADVVQAIQSQSQQVTGGQVGAPPAPADQAFQFTVNVQGRLADPAEFGSIIVKAAAGAVTRVRDVGRVELGSQTYSQVFTSDGKPAAGIAIAQTPDANALAVAREDGGAVEVLSPRPRLFHPVRYHRLRESLDPRGLQDALRGSRARAGRHPRLLAGLARDAGAGDERSGDDHRRVRRDGGARLHGQPLHPVRADPLHRHRGGRRDRGRGGGIGRHGARHVVA